MAENVLDLEEKYGEDLITMVENWRQAAIRDGANDHSKAAFIALTLAAASAYLTWKAFISADPGREDFLAECKDSYDVVIEETG